jgi:hypothetical protein
MRQLNIRLDDEIVSCLSSQATLQGISVNVLCQKILSSSIPKIKGGDTLLVSSRRLFLQLDVVASCLRSLERKINLNNGEHRP